MKAQSWTLAVRDVRGKRHRGEVCFVDRTPKRSPEPPATFRIALLTSPSTPTFVPGGTALCVPHLARGAALLDSVVQAPGVRAEIAAMRRGEMGAARHAQYRAGEIYLPSGTLEAAKVFVRGSRIDLEHLALLLVEQQLAEALAPFLAIIRHELAMPPLSNALLALETRLFPADSSERPPARAPGIARLRKALKRLGAGEAPDVTLDELTADLRFLRAFEPAEHLLRRAALDRLLSDVQGPGRPAGPAVHRRAAPARIIKLRPRRDT